MRRIDLRGLSLLLALPPLAGCAGGADSGRAAAPAQAVTAVPRPPLRLAAAGNVVPMVLDDPARPAAVPGGGLPGGAASGPAGGLPATAPTILVDPAAGGADENPDDQNDPFERINRGVLDFNLALTDHLFGPIADAYRVVVPTYVRTRLRNFLRNLGEPIIFANNVLQGRFLDAGHTTMRFFLNTTAGIGGLYDIAGPSGIARRTGDFGQTLYRYGVPSGPYLMLPVLGPSQVRDAVGDGVDALMNPISIAINEAATAGVANALNLGRGGLGGLDLLAEHKDEFRELRETSIDFYARLRSVVRQQREAEIGRTTEPVVEVLAVPGGSIGTGPVRSPDTPSGAPLLLDDPADLPAPAPAPRQTPMTRRQAPAGGTAQVRAVPRRSAGRPAPLARAQPAGAVRPMAGLPVRAGRTARLPTVRWRQTVAAPAVSPLAGAGRPFPPAPQQGREGA
ncbi:MlaA family lipoprotein [Roseomonas sp. NAR14]|uniref:MlaA family lipoprotein n=1 Tax=Roseomonas acroporae TaxID=2937791 RepID=A0A9X1Y776_9PROT|nr:VacJ family lipoprotein [Roseomonas acroporae]MCK8784848.1 MlaA family lipoprotein [Roseomonas acroporae]